MSEKAKWSDLSVLIIKKFNQQHHDTNLERKGAIEEYDETCVKDKTTGEYVCTKSNTRAAVLSVTNYNYMLKDTEGLLITNLPTLSDSDDKLPEKCITEPTDTQLATFITT